MKQIDETTDTTRLNGGISKHIKSNDQEIDLWYNGHEDYREKPDPFLFDCTLRPDIEYYKRKHED